MSTFVDDGTHTGSAFPSASPMARPVNRRTFLGAALGAAVFLRNTVPGAALEATPEPPARSDLSIGSYASPNPGSVNLHWIGTPRGLVVIDGLRTLTDAREAVRVMQRLGQPVLAVFLTHPHPDHVGGLGTLREAFGPMPIYAEQETIDILREDRGGLLALTRQVAGDDYPDQITLPDQAVTNGQEVELGGVGFHVRLLGPGEAAAMAVVHVPEASVLFTGDIVCHEMTPFLLEGRTSQWIDQLLRLAVGYPDVEAVYPGHGEPAPHAIIAQQLGYLATVRDLVGRRLTADGSLTAADKAALLAQLEGLYAGYQPVATLPDLSNLNLDAVAAELATESETS